MSRTKVVIMGAAGRDFHNFNTLFRDSEAHEVVAFTATQIPDIEGRVYPPELAGDLYPEGIPIRAEEELERIVRDQAVDQGGRRRSDAAAIKAVFDYPKLVKSGFFCSTSSPRISTS